MEQVKPNVINKSFAAAVATRPRAPFTVAMATPGNASNSVGNNNVVNNSLRRQGIAFDSLQENVAIEVYLDALSKNVSTSSITHISKSSRMINVYFTSATWADQMIRDGLDVRDFHLDVRPIATTPIKVIVSNVPPEIGHQFLRNEMSKYGRVVGPITTLSAATSRPEYSHIRSFRRMLLMEFSNDDAMDKLPRQMNYTLDGKPYSFYTSLDVKCFRCGKMGHFRKSCPETLPLSYSDQTGPTILKPTDPTGDVNQLRDDTLVPTSESQPEVPEIPENRFECLDHKQPSGEENGSTTSPRPKNKKKTKKLKRSGSPTELLPTIAKVQAREAETYSQSEDDTLSSAPGSEYEDMDSDPGSGCWKAIESGLLDNFSNDSPLTIPSLLMFLNEVKGCPHRLKVAKKYTNDIPGLIKQVKELALVLKKSPIKSKVLSQPRIARVYSGLNDEFNFVS